jgi:hypothetical protein
LILVFCLAKVTAEIAVESAVAVAHLYKHEPTCLPGSLPRLLQLGRPSIRIAINVLGQCSGSVIFCSDPVPAINKQKLRKTLIYTVL